MLVLMVMAEVEMEVAVVVAVVAAGYDNFLGSATLVTRAGVNVVDLEGPGDEFGLEVVVTLEVVVEVMVSQPVAVAEVVVVPAAFEKGVLEFGPAAPAVLAAVAIVVVVAQTGVPLVLHVTVAVAALPHLFLC